MENGITKKGDIAVEKFLLIVPECEKYQKNSPCGDLRIFEKPLEIKKNSLNQIRPKNKCPIICFYEKTGEWSFIPFLDVMEMASKVKKGQHTINQFECFNISSKKKVMEKYKLSVQELREKVLEYGKKDYNDKEREVFIMIDEMLNKVEEIKLEFINKYASI